MKNVQTNLFSGMDHVIVRAAVKRLPGLLGAVVEMRFWGEMTLAEIAVDLGVSIKAVEIAIGRATERLREECLRHPSFSRSRFTELQSLGAEFVA